MSAWDNLSERDRELVIIALRSAPVEGRDELEELADRLELRDPLMGMLMELASDIRATAADVQKRALIGTVRELKGMAGALAQGLGRAVALIDEKLGDDATVFVFVEQARHALLTWRHAEARVDELLKALRPEPGG